MQEFETQYCILIDWGTTNFRAYLVAPNGNCIDERHSSSGIKKIAAGNCHNVLQANIGDWIEKYNSPRIVMAGMVGSELGICEVPLLSAPCSCFDLQKNLFEFEMEDGNAVHIVPGVLSELSPIPGVMRGEEVQALGAISLADVDDALVCMPGTHTKWVSLKSKKIVAISTFMTGEIFSLMRNNSVLSKLVDCDNTIIDKEGFIQGIESAQTGRSIAQLMFMIRTEAIAYGKPDRCRELARLSGMLIGAEIFSCLSEMNISEGSTVIISASSALAEVYKIALQEFGAHCEVINSRETFLTGSKIVAGMRSGQKLAQMT